MNEMVFSGFWWMRRVNQYCVLYFLESNAFRADFSLKSSLDSTLVNGKNKIKKLN